MGDLDNDGVIDIAVGAPGDDDGGSGRGAVYVLFLTTSGTVKSYQKISDTAGSFAATMANSDAFGSAIAGMPMCSCSGPSQPVGLQLCAEGFVPVCMVRL